MPTVLIVWELGAGWGHVSRLRPIATELQERGHQVIVALRDVAGTGALFASAGIPCLPAPFKLGWPSNAIRPAVGFSHILHNIGFANEGELASLIASWKSLFDLVDPDLVLFDHSPTALLAARGCRAGRVVVGDGFCCPPDADHLPSLVPWRNVDGERLKLDDAKVLANANRALSHFDAPPLNRLADIYHDVEAHVFTTFAELDHFGSRPEAHYFGHVAETMGTAPSWPPGGAHRALAYVRPFAGLDRLVQALADLRVSTLMYCPGAERSPLATNDLVRAIDRPIDFSVGAEESDIAILNASHGTTCTMLLYGKPILQIPLHLEQQLVANRSVELGAALAVNRTRDEQMVHQLRKLIEVPQYRLSAQRFARRYVAHDAREALRRALIQIEDILRVAA